MSTASNTTVGRLLAVARGDAPADVVLRNGRIVNVFSGELEHADIAIAGDRIAGVGAGYAGTHEIDLAGAYVAPGLIDAHVHIESSLCTPPHFASAVVPRGITTVVADPHEIANVAGLDGVRFMAESSRDLPLRVVLMAPSCVPATDLATAGAHLTPDDLQQLLADGIVHGLAEVMNFPGVIRGDGEVLRKINAFAGKPIDGHSPGVSGHALNAYATTGVGSDHECVTLVEAREKLARGLYVFIREATNARNFDTLLPLITPANSRRICFCTDDRTPCDLLEEGSIDNMVRRAIAGGVEFMTAIRCATLNTAEWFGLHDHGAIAPGRFADLFIFDDLSRPVAREVYAGGRQVARDGKPTFTASQNPVPIAVLNTVHIASADTNVTATSDRMRVIGARPNQLLTDALILPPLLRDDCAIADPQRDILKMMVIERHGRSGQVGVGFVKGFGLKRGAIAGTVAHDHHNIVVIGCADAPMWAAALNIAHAGGGLIVIDRMDTTLAALRLPIAGLMSDQPIEDVARDYRALLEAAHSLGATMHDPFMAMSFMALEVIPSLKLTDLGLVDVDQFKHVDLFV